MLLSVILVFLIIIIVLIITIVILLLSGSPTHSLKSVGESSSSLVALSSILITLGALCLLLRASFDFVLEPRIPHFWIFGHEHKDEDEDELGILVVGFDHHR